MAIRRDIYFRKHEYRRNNGQCDHCVEENMKGRFFHESGDERLESMVDNDGYCRVSYVENCQTKLLFGIEPSFTFRIR